MQIREVWVDRGDFRHTRIVDSDLPEPVDGEILVAVESFALTANNVSYALSGDMLGYWGYFPAADNWGKVPAWGYARVLVSRCAGIQEGERFWGFLPMASHLMLQPGRVTARALFDMAPHRQALPTLYNSYTRVAADPPGLEDLEHERSLLFPLFATSYLLYDYLVDNAFFGAGQVVIGSASSKTAFGLACLLYADGDVSVCGLTSECNRAFVAGLYCCHSVLSYAEVGKISADHAIIFVDMAGDAQLTAAVHRHLQSQLRQSIKVGATHWEAGDARSSDLPGPAPAFFFAPAQIEKRDAQWGAGVVMHQAFAASADMARSIGNQLEIDERSGAEAVVETWKSLLDNRVSPQQGRILSMPSS